MLLYELERIRGLDDSFGGWGVVGSLNVLENAWNFATEKRLGRETNQIVFSFRFLAFTKREVSRIEQITTRGLLGGFFVDGRAERTKGQLLQGTFFFI